MTAYYTGIGSRQTPATVCARMTRVAVTMRERGFILRSGAAEGADSAFEKGAGDAKEIWVPWVGFRGHASTLTPIPEAFEIAKRFHPAWHRCNDAARKLHARNVHQVLGADLRTPSEFVVCWTKDGKDSGGTGTAIRIAWDRKIPVRFLKEHPADGMPILGSGLTFEEQ